MMSVLEYALDINKTVEEVLKKSNMPIQGSNRGYNPFQLI